MMVVHVSVSAILIALLVHTAIKVCVWKGVAVMMPVNHRLFVVRMDNALRVNKTSNVKRVKPA